MTTLLLLLLAAQAPVPQRFLTKEQALRIALPDAERVLRRTLRLTEAEAAAIQRLAPDGTPVGRGVAVHVGLRAGQPSGFALVLEEVGRFHPITFIVGLDLRARVADVAVMEYREEVGSEVRRRIFLRQFEGLSPASSIRRDRDLINVSGATMSVDAIARGVRKAVAIVDRHLVRDPARLAALLQEEPARQQRYVMGTLLTITAYGATEETLDAAFGEVRRWDRILSHWEAESDLSRLSARAGQGPVPASVDLVGFLRRCAELTDLTGGAFDITIGPAIEAWGFRDRNYRVPADGELAALVRCVGWGKVRLGERTAELTVEGMRLDPGGIGKGFAIDRAVDVLLERGVTAACVDFGSTAYALGAPPGVDGWPAAVRDPFGGDPLPLRLRDRAISTSGSYENSFERDGVRYAHILDPRTLLPVAGVASVSVLAPDATGADALSTGLFVLGVEAGRALAERLEDVEALLQPDDRATPPLRTSGWPGER